MLGKRLIFVKLATKNPPNYLTLLKDVMKHLQLEQIKFSLGGKVNMFYLIWQPFID